jgi:competence protein ComEA
MEPIGALLERHSQAIVIALAALLAAALVAFAIERRDSNDGFDFAAGATPTAGGPIQVYVTGAVMQPGVYEMADGDRVVDLLYKAGGQAPDANLEAINLAVRLHDEDQVLVPRIGQAAVASDVAGVSNSGGLVNINTASADELDALPGIGEVYSQRIVENRAASGLFVTADDLVNRDIIPRGTYDKIRDLITVGP